MSNNNSNNSESHQAYATAIGVCAFFVLLIFGMKACTEINVEREKTNQLEIIYKNKQK